MKQPEIFSAKMEQEFQDLDRGWVAAYLQGSPELFDRIWSDGFIFTFPFGQFTNKEREISDIKSGNLSIDSLSTDDMKVKLYGDIALTAGRITMKGRYRGRDISGQYRYTNVLGKRRAKRWQIVASQAVSIA